MGLGVVGLELQRFLETGHGLVDLSATRQNYAEIVVGELVVGLDFQRLLVMCDGRVNLSAHRQEQAKIVVRHPALRILGDGRPIECFVVDVHPALSPSQDGQHDQQPQTQHEGGGRREKTPSGERCRHASEHGAGHDHGRILPVIRHQRVEHKEDVHKT